MPGVTPATRAVCSVVGVSVTRPVVVRSSSFTCAAALDFQDAEFVSTKQECDLTAPFVEENKPVAAVLAKPDGEDEYRVQKQGKLVGKLDKPLTGINGSLCLRARRWSGAPLCFPLLLAAWQRRADGSLEFSDGWGARWQGRLGQLCVLAGRRQPGKYIN